METAVFRFTSCGKLEAAGERELQQKRTYRFSWGRENILADQSGLAECIVGSGTAANPPRERHRRQLRKSEVLNLHHGLRLLYALIASSRLFGSI